MYKYDFDPYFFDDRKHWIKHKGTNDCDVMLYGFSDTSERSDRLEKFGFGGFKMALLKDENLIDCGVVGNGLSEDEWIQLKELINSGKKPIVEIRFSDIMMPRENSYTFRFARMIKIRDDKTEPDTIERLDKDFEIKVMV
jgi:ATP-dependent DNA ligase